MKSIQLLLLGVFAFGAAACTETVYVHHRRHSSYSTVPGTPVHLANPGAPETFRAVSDH